MKNSKNRGSMIIEAAIFLPIFILGVVSLMYIAKVIWIQESLFRSFYDEARKLSVEAYAAEKGAAGNAGFSGAAGIAGAAHLNHGIDAAFAASGVEDHYTLLMNEYQYMFESKGMKDMIAVGITCSVKPDMPMGFIKEINLQNQLLFRAWTGENGGSPPMGFEEMKQDGNAEIVYIFPHSGKKYHKLTCGYISVYPEKTVLSKALRKTYLPCRLCHSEDMEIGDVVYCFSVYGKVYHRAGCTAVTKYIEKIEKTDAEAMGYLPCSKCGG